jgi:hypothetical protein
MSIRMNRGIGAALLALVVTAPVAAPAAAQDDEALTAKLDGYIDCLNRHRNWTYQSRQRYFSWLKSPERGPTGREDIVYGLYTLYDTADCAQAVAVAADLPPDDARLEADARAWVDALQALEKQVAEASRYYELEDYKDDGMERGKALHGPLVAAFAAFETADDAFFDAVTSTAEAKAKRDLDRLEADPARRAEFVLAELLARAKDLVVIGMEAGGDAFSSDDYAGALAAYSKAFDALESYRKEHPDDDRDGFDVQDEALEFLKSAKRLGRRERDGMKFDEGERMIIEAGAGQMIEGHPLHLVEQYNRYVDASNRAR